MCDPDGPRTKEASCARSVLFTPSARRHTDAMADVDHAAPPRAPYPFTEGDRFESVAEFERLREQIQDGTRAELIDGVVYMTPPASDGHGEPHIDLAGLLAVYRSTTPGVRASLDQIAHPDDASSVAADLALIIDPAAGGAVRRVAGAWDGPLDLAIEVSRTSSSHDLGPKRAVIERNGVREYMVWVVATGTVRWWRLAAGKFVPLEPGPDGVLRSTVFPGLWLDGDALKRGDAARLQAVLSEGLRSPEHAAFAAALRAHLGG